MALQVWLPLLNDAHNQGLMDVEPTVMGTGITYTAGKLGDSATFPCSAASCIHMPGLQQQGSFSWACWFKCTGNGVSTYNQYILSEGRDTGSIGVNIYLNNAGTSLVARDGQSTQTVAVTLNEWHHVAFVFDGTNKHLYVDGVFIASTVAKSEHDYAQSNDRFVIGKMAYSYTNTSSYFPFNGQICDVRIYDHALSVKEVKEIAKGLIAHYPLNDKITVPNLLPHSRPSASNLSLIGVNTSYVSFVTEDGRDCYQCGTGNTTPSSMSMNWQNTVLLDADTTYTYSAWIKSNKSDVLSFIRFGHFQVYNSASTATDKTHEDVAAQRIYYPSRIEAGEWTKISLTFTTNSLDNSIFRVFPTYNVSSDCIVYICDQKLEVGLTATQWIPNVSDSEYVDLKLYENKIYDCSGYGRHGVVTDASNLFSETPTAYTPNSYTAYKIPISEKLVAGQTYMIQLWDVDVRHSAKADANIGVDFYLGGGYLQMAWWRGTSYFTNGHADYLTKSFTVTETQASHADGGNLFFHVYNSVGYVAGDMYMHIGRWRLEKGSVATNTELTGDTPRYQIATNFVSKSFIHATPNLGDLSEVTISFWVKQSSGSGNYSTVIANKATLGGAGLWLAVNTESVGLWFYSWRNKVNLYCKSNKGKLILDKWYHAVFVFDNGVASWYQNGEPAGTSDISANQTVIPINDLYIGDPYTGSSWNTTFLGSLSDVRIYATALSAEDIKELYETSASIDQNGNTWAYELEEV